MIKNFPAQLEHLYEMLSFVRDYAEKLGFDHAKSSKIELACEEALVNIISYGYPSSDNGIISISCRVEDDAQLELIIRDDGIPYDPILAGQFFDLAKHRKKDIEGGYGVFFILKIMDTARYERVKGQNILTLKKNLPVR